MFDNRPDVHRARTAHRPSFVPALGLAALTPLYAALSGLTRPTLQRFLRRTGFEEGMTILDVGCGSGVLALLIKQAYPTARVVGLDVDPAVLDAARDRIARTRVDVELQQGTIETAEFAPRSFDRIVSTFVLHHLTTDEKRSMLATSHRLLRPGGQLHVVDFGAPRNALMRLLALPLRALGGERVTANTCGSVPALMHAAGFADVEQVGATSSLLGTIAHWSATLPERPHRSVPADSAHPDPHQTGETTR